MRGTRLSRSAAGSTLTFRTTSNKMIRREHIIFIGKKAEELWTVSEETKGL